MTVKKESEWLSFLCYIRGNGGTMSALNGLRVGFLHSFWRNAVRFFEGFTERI